MKYIYLLRHAKSSWTNPLLKDHDRPLSERGIKACHKIETFISQNKIIPEIAYISSSQRTISTYELIFKRKLYPNVLISIDKTIYLCASKLLREKIINTDNKFNHLLIVNHEPTIRKLTLELSENSKKMRFKNDVSLKYPTCSLAILKLNSDNWYDSKKNNCELINFIKPKDL